MSHFTVLVIGPDIEAQLQPYHEYECTGIEDQYVVDVDVTAEITEQFNKTQRVVQLSDGAFVCRFSDALYTGDPTHRFGNKTFVMPEGAVELELSADAARARGIGYATMADAAREWCGAEAKADGRFYRRTNPNKKWDWYKVGGRWTGYLKLKVGCAGDLGVPGLLTDPAGKGTADIALKGAVDFDGMRNDAGLKAGNKWDKVRLITSDLWDSWDTIKARTTTIDEARTAYHAQPALKALKTSGDDEFRWDIDDALTGLREDYVQAARDSAVSTFAAVKDGKWIERGEMGWFACVSNEQDKGEWGRKFNEMLDALPNDTLLTVVDCHI